MSARIRALLLVAAIAVTYVLAARLGFLMATVAEQVTVVWPPSGIALAAVLLFGRKAWPGIWIGAFAANVTSHEPMLVAAAIATGNTLEAGLGAWLLERLGRFDLRLGRLRDVFTLAILAAGVSTTASATIGTVSLCVGGVQPWRAFADLWRTWWLGDAVGDLVATPLVLALATVRRDRWTLVRLAETGVFLAALTLTCLLAFHYSFAGFQTGYPLPYMVFPFLIWAALRFGRMGTATAIAITSVTAIWSTVQGTGPFAAASPSDSLILVQIFLSVAALTTLVLGAAIAERNSGNARRAAQYDAIHTISTSGSLEEAAPRVLEAICRDLDWDVGGLWGFDPAGQHLVLLRQWHRPGIRVEGFEAMSRATRLSRGVGLPGRVWEGNAPAWIPDVTRDPNFPRAEVAAREGMRGAFGFPVILDGSVVAVLEFFSREIRQPDAEILASFGAIGNELGLYIGRKRAEEALREADRRKDQFLAVLAHELRNPLAPVRNTLEILRRHPQTDELRWACDVIDRQVTHLTRLVDDLLDVARISTQRINVQRERVDLHEVIDRALEMSREAVERRGHRLRVLLPDEPVVIEGDRIRLAQAVGNLLDNAAKYSDDGGEITLAVERAEAAATIRVSDRGIGILPEDLSRIFELFAQGDPALGRSRGGLGVGLSLVRQLVEMQGGRVRADSAGAGLGSDFTITIPLPDASPAKPEPVGSALPATAPKRRVLVVDDNRDSADTMGAILAREGHDVRVLYTGEDALDTAPAFRPEVVILDLGLPGKDGYEVAGVLRAQPHGDGLLLIAMTGYGQHSDKERSAQVGFDIHLTKPVDPKALLERIARGKP